MARRRALVVTVAVAVLATTAGYVAAAQIRSPASELARTAPPPAGPVTAPVERRVLESRVTVRGDVVFDDARDIAVDTSRLDVAPVVTGTPTPAGAGVAEGDVLLEIGGRPVIALDGPLPVYRGLQPGSAGPDVLQLEQALVRLGLEVGTVDDVYDVGTGAAVATLYHRSGYVPPVPDPATTARLSASVEAQERAASAVDEARVALELAAAGPTDSERMALDAAVNAAERTLHAAIATGIAADVDSAREQLGIAAARRDEQTAPSDTSRERAQVAAAEAALAAAHEERWSATLAASTPLPAAEVVFVDRLPRRVDELLVEQGTMLAGPALRLSGAEVVVRVVLGPADRALLAEGMSATVGAGPVELGGTISHLDDDARTGGSTATVTLAAPTPEQIAAIEGRNVKVTIPISATDGAVLVVPVAALTAGPAGEARVERVGADGTVELVPVTVGLAADGSAEVRPGEGARLAEGDAVVVGR